MTWIPIFCKAVLEPFVGRVVSYVAYVCPPEYDTAVEYEEYTLERIEETPEEDAFLILVEARDVPVRETTLVPIALITDIRFYQEGA